MNTKKVLNIKKYQKLFRFDDFIPFILSYDFVNGYIHLDGMTFSQNKIWLSYMSKSALNKTLKEGLSLYKDRKKYQNYKDNLYKTFKDIESTINKYKKKSLSQKQIIEFISLLKQYRIYYTKAEFFYTDLAFEKKEEFPSIKKNFKSFEKFKLDGRDYLNKIFFVPNSIFSAFIKIISKQFEIPYNDLLSYSYDDLINLYKNKKVQRKIIKQRQEAYLIYTDKKKIKSILGQEAKDFIKGILSKEKYLSTFSGRIANKGKVIAKAKVIKMALSNYSKVSKIIDKMEQGQVLVVETTEPAIIIACKKASAIVTNQGGMMSHAAIISRELNIPCIVGTNIATDVIKDGDLVEVDANKGVVKILKK